MVLLTCTALLLVCGWYAVFVKRFTPGCAHIVAKNLLTIALFHRSKKTTVCLMRCASEPLAHSLRARLSISMSELPSLA